MKKLAAICLVCVLTTAAWGMFIQTIIAFDENGNGTYYDGIEPDTLLFGVGIPPSPIPGHATLFYALPDVVIEGDVVLYEPDALGNPTSVISYILRFDIAEPPCVFVYSDNDDGGDGLADTGIPDVWNGGAGGIVYLTEEGSENSWSGIHYTPLPNQPGYIANANVTYIFTSDIPEPATVALLSIGALSLIRRKNDIKQIKH